MALLLDSDTSELVFLFEGNRQLSSSIRLRNTTENHVAFKILCTKPRRYGVQPWIGILSPGELCEVTVKTQAPRRAPSNTQSWQSRDIFQIQSVLARPGTTKEEAPNLFNRAVDRMLQESRLRVAYTVPQGRVALPGAQNSTQSSLATTPEVTDPVDENQPNDLEVDESWSIIEASASQVVHNLVRAGNIHIGALIFKCFICTFFVVVSCCLIMQTCSLIWAFTKLMVMLMMKMVTKFVSESIEDWVGRTLIGLFMSLVYKNKEWLRNIMLRSWGWDRVTDLKNWKTKFLHMLTNLKIK